MEPRTEENPPSRSAAGRESPAPGVDAARRLAALVALLGDDSPEVHGAARAALEAAGPRALPHLRRAARSAHAATRGRARDLLAGLARGRARRRLIRHLAGEVRLEPALFLIARLESPGLDALPYRKALDAFAAIARKRIEASPNQHPAHALAGVLGGEIGLRGSSEDYHHPDRIHVHRVIETRLGLPLSLCAIYLFVARRIGVRAGALPIPGHVVLRVHGAEGPALLDPFHGGRAITHQECVAHLERHGLAPQPQWFREAPDALLVQRQLTNLMQSMRLRGRPARAREAHGLASFVERRRRCRRE